MEITLKTKQEACLDYLNRGWKLVPIKAFSKKAILKDWTTKPIDTFEKMNTYFEKNKDTNVGILCGKPSGIVVIDLDVEKDANGELTGYDGITSLRQKEAELRSILPDTVTSQTQGGGLQLWFKYPDGVNKITSTIGKMRSVDIRADGSQVVVYPSVGEKGKYYWLSSPQDSELAELPKEWIEYLTTETHRPKEENDRLIKLAMATKSFEVPASIPCSTRNDTLFKYACSLFAKRNDLDEVKNTIHKANNELCERPLTDDEVNTIINSAYRLHEKNIDQVAEEIVETVNVPKEKAVDMADWLIVSPKGGYGILEPEFAKWFIDNEKIYCINGCFYNETGELKDAFVKSKVQEIIAPFIKVSVSDKVNALTNALKNASFFEPPKPIHDVVNFENTSIKVTGDELIPVKKTFTFNKLPVLYKPHEVNNEWLKYIHDLMDDEDVLLLQEYMGYCLLPTTIAQKALFIVGEGGEGKGGITVVMQKIFGKSLVSGEFIDIPNDSFITANLENKLVFIDDDLEMSSLEKTGVFKKYVTMTGKITVQKKGIQHYEIQPYVRFLCLGNGVISAKYDKSEGFMDRLMVIRVKKIKRRGTDLDDKSLYSKLIVNTSGIINWCLEGLQRLIRNNYNFTISQKGQQVIEDIKEDRNNVITFSKDEDYVHYGKNLTTTTKELLESYESWCKENGYKPLSSRAVTGYFKVSSERLGLKEDKNIKRGTKYCRGFTGMTTSLIKVKGVKDIDDEL